MFKDKGSGFDILHKFYYHFHAYILIIIIKHPVLLLYYSSLSFFLKYKHKTYKHSSLR